MELYKEQARHIENCRTCKGRVEVALSLLFSAVKEEQERNHPDELELAHIAELGDSAEVAKVVSEHVAQCNECSSLIHTLRQELES